MLGQLKYILLEALVDTNPVLTKFETIKCDVEGCYGDSIGSLTVPDSFDRAYNLCSDHYASLENKLEGL